ncbi:hypothetical protein OOJ91_13650 [Micromonospora lupini]|uniref:DUF7620 family protein n=1 Tax=Micromonospora lupini TaxID=285679 RepID=UPI00225257B5|nr:hypothetical protein [Micromonospora lupini]MCX5066891.1 hypothetical protein [Micromonospora lupini]
MTWWRRRRGPSPETEAARDRAADAERSLQRARADDDTVDAVAAKLVELRRRNHFGPMITSALRGSR